jgi:8-oxo-dGTP pyrophosphatase MutT (NUDIX family)
MERPTFYHKDKPVRAAGILIWTNSNGQALYLFNNCKGRYEDMGGKTDPGDRDAMDTAIREATEETNGKIFSNNHSTDDCKNCLYHHVVNHSEILYNSKSKYLLYKVYVDPTLTSLNMKRFGRTEKTEWGDLDHYFQWKKHVPRQLHPRLFGMRL